MASNLTDKVKTMTTKLKKTDDELVEAVPQLPSKRFKGVVHTPHGDASFHSEYEAARDYIWDAVSEKFDRDFPCAFVKVQP